MNKYVSKTLSNLYVTKVRVLILYCSSTIHIILSSEFLKVCSYFTRQDNRALQSSKLVTKLKQRRLDDINDQFIKKNPQKNFCDNAGVILPA